MSDDTDPATRSLHALYATLTFLLLALDWIVLGMVSEWLDGPPYVGVMLVMMLPLTVVLLHWMALAFRTWPERPEPEEWY